MLEIKNVTKKFNNYKATNNVSLKVDKGEIVGLLGPNGAGKSTTMKIIAGIYIPDEGDVFINGKSVKDFPYYAKKRIGFMPENNPLYKDLTVKESIQLSLNLSNITGTQLKERLDYVVNVTSLKEVLNKPIAELSKGFKQRVGLANVLAPNPEILILDEPTEGLDPNQRVEIRNLISNLAKEKTVVISTHVLQEVEAICNRIVIINNGSIIADGSKESILGSKLGNVKFELTLLANKKPGLKLNSIEQKLIESNNNLFKYAITAKDKLEIILEINNFAKENNLQIYELKILTQNLEDVFRSLTKTI